MGLQEAYRGLPRVCGIPSCHRESQSRVSVVMIVVSENELKRKLSVGPGLIVDKTTLVSRTRARKLSPDDCDMPVAYLQTAISE